MATLLGASMVLTVLPPSWAAGTENQPEELPPDSEVSEDQELNGEEDSDQEEPAEEESETPNEEDEPSEEEEPDQTTQHEVADGARVLVSELNNGGPGGYHDNFIEIANWGEEAQDLEGWTVYRCTGAGNQAADPQVTLDGTLEPGEQLLLARTHAQSTLSDDIVDQRYGTSFANDSYGAIIRDAEGEIVDRVGVKFPNVAGTACVDGTELPNTTDSYAGQSWQRIGDTGDNSADFITAERTPGQPNAEEPAPGPVGGDILISEVAHAGPEGEDDHLVELGNYGDTEVDLEGWELWRCNEWGQRFAADQLSDDLSSIAPGEALVVEAPNGFVPGRNNAGVMLRNADGQLVDAVAWADNETGACAHGDPLPYYDLDVAAGNSYQRESTEGENAETFVQAERSPGQLEANDPVEQEETEQFLSTEDGANVLVSEMTNNGPQGAGDIFFELTNYGDEPQDLSGWSVYRCIGTGVRASVPQLALEDLEGVVLEPGEMLTAARAQQAGPDIMAVADFTFDISFADQYGLIIFDENSRVVDRVGSAPAGVQNYCAQDYGALPGTAHGLYAESWQRIDLTGDAEQDWHLAPRTPGRVNDPGTWERPRTESDVLVTEVANGGPEGAADNFMELTNLGDEEVNIGGWRFYRCAGTGRVHEQTLQLTLPDHTLAPGESFVAGRQNGFSGEADALYNTSFATDGGFGVVITDADRTIIDTVGVFSGVDSPCTDGEALPNDLDFVEGESWQRTDTTGDNRADFDRGLRTPGEHGEELVSVQPEVLEPSDVQIVELAAGGPADLEGSTSEGFVEIANRGEEEVDISDWEVYYCTADGRRIPTPQAQFEQGATLAPDEVFTLANPNPAEGLGHDAVARDELDPEGYGVMITDEEGAIVDRVGVYYSYAGAVTNAPPSLCTGEMPLDVRVAKESVDKAFEYGFSWHRVQYTGDNYEDYYATDRDPGEYVQLDYVDPLVPEEGALDPVNLDRFSFSSPAELASQVSAETGDPAQELTAQAGAEGTMSLRGGGVVEPDFRTFTGVAAEAGLAGRTGEDETETQGVQTEIADAERGFPYLRMEIEADELGESSEIIWTGSSQNRNELQLYLWDGQSWELIDARAAEEGGEITLTAQPDPEHIQEGAINVLIQDGPRTLEILDQEENLSFQDPGSYDFSIGHLTDTQYTAEQNPWVYTAMNAWFAANMDSRDIAFQMHTGDIIENALRGNQTRERADREFERVSVIQEILEDSGLPHAVLPGNHDNFWGNNSELYLEYFPEERYADYEWYGEAGPLGNSSSYSVIEQDGVKMLFLSLAYYTHELELQWAEEIIAEHPDHNVVIGTHEYLRPEIDERANPDNGRWSSQGDVYFERLVEPNANVVLVLSGHLHGIRQREEGTQDDHWVVETVADFQSYEHEGGRTALFNRLMQIDVDSGQMAVNHYTPIYDSFEPHQFQPPERAGQFGPELDEAMMSIDLMWSKEVSSQELTVLTEVEALSEEQEVTAEEPAETAWEGLTEDETYGWYALTTSESLGRVDENRPSAVQTFTAGVPEEEPDTPYPGESESPRPDPTEPEPTEPEPTEPETTEPEPSEPEPSEPEPTEPEPTETAPTEPAPTETESGEPDPRETEPGDSDPTQPTPTESETTTPTPTQEATADPVPGAPEAGELTDEYEGLIELLNPPLVPGGTAEVQIGQDHQDEPTVAGWLFSEPVSLGTSEVDDQGIATLSVPEDVSPGEHRLALYTAEGELIGWTYATVIVPDDDDAESALAELDGQEDTETGGLAVTGTQMSALALGAVLLLLIGAVLVAISRHRRAQRAEQVSTEA